MDEIVVVVPVLGRPERVEPLLASLEQARGAASYRPVFVVSPGDAAEREALRAADAEILETSWPAGRGDYARKINLAFDRSKEPWLFAAADDLLFHPGWADEALKMADATSKQVIGTNDLGNSRVVAGLHSTHTLFGRSYVDRQGTIDEPGKVYCPLYDHQFIDDEAVSTARFRNQFAFARDSIVEHLHPDWGKAPSDPTYDKAKRGLWEDKALYESREVLWGIRVRIHDPYAPVRPWPSS